VLTRQYTALLSTEGVDLSFTPDGIDEIARIADDVNSSAENIGARRLHTILEKVLEDVAFSAPEASGAVVVGAAYVKERLAGVIARSDFSDYVL
jgi:ATP-dependent HslUV protease ATP-binding subunit HslU